MKKCFLSTVALLSLSAAALAADLRSQRAPAPFISPAPVFTWTGFYVGANIGWAFRGNDDDRRFIAPNSIVDITGAPKPTTGTIVFRNNDGDDGITGGAHIGYNVQMGAFVVGIEADIKAADLNNGGPTPYTFTGFADSVAGLGTTTIVVRNQRGIDWWGSVRARAGVAFDRLLVYATGGFAYGGGGENTCFAGASVSRCDDDDWRGGYAVGGGAEWALGNNWTVGLEGLYVNLNRDNNHRPVFNPTTNTLFLNNGDDEGFGVVHAKVNFKF